MTNYNGPGYGTPDNSYSGSGYQGAGYNTPDSDSDDGYDISGYQLDRISNPYQENANQLNNFDNSYSEGFVNTNPSGAGYGGSSAYPGYGMPESNPYYTDSYQDTNTSSNQWDWEEELEL